MKRRINEKLSAQSASYIDQVWAEFYRMAQNNLGVDTDHGIVGFVPSFDPMDDRGDDDQVIFTQLWLDEPDSEPIDLDPAEGFIIQFSEEDGVIMADIIPGDQTGVIETLNWETDDLPNPTRAAQQIWDALESDIEKWDTSVFLPDDMEERRTAKRRRSIKEQISDPYEWLDKVWLQIKSLVETDVDMGDYALTVSPSPGELSNQTQVFVIDAMPYTADFDGNPKIFDEHIAVDADVADDEVNIAVQMVNAGTGPEVFTYASDSGDLPDVYHTALEIADTINTDIEDYFSGLGSEDFEERKSKRTRRSRKVETRTPIADKLIAAGIGRRVHEQDEMDDDPVTAFGFDIAVTQEDVIEQNLRERVDDDEELRQQLMDAGFVTEDGEITEAGWDQLMEDDQKLEQNMLGWLRDTFNNARDEGHSGDSSLVGTLWIDLSDKDQVEWAIQGMDEGIRSYDLSEDVYKGLSEIGVQALDADIYLLSTNWGEPSDEMDLDRLEDILAGMRG